MTMFRVLGWIAALTICWVASVAAAGAAASADEVAGRRAALVIGNSGYENLPALPNAVNDAERVGAVLREANFEVTVGENLDKASLEKTVRAFLQTLNDSDVALFYYSGHAVQVAGENFILPVDASLKSAYDLEVESYSVSSLLDYMRAASGLQILVLDACRDNPFRSGEYFLGEKKIDVKGEKGLASIAPRQGALIVYSTAPNEVAFDGAGDISPFAGSFAENVLTPNREIRDVLTKVRSEVIDKTAGKQVPWDVSSLTSQFYFVSAQNLLTLSRNVTEVRVLPETTRIELDIAPPIASGSMSLSAVFEKLPATGLLLLDEKAVKAGAPFDAARISDVVYVTDPGQKAVELIPYSILSDTGLSANGAVAVVFDPTAKADAPAVAAAPDVSADAVTVAVNSDVGTGFEPLPAVIRGAPGKDGWFRIDRRDAATQVALDQTMLIVGDLVKAEDLPKVKVRPALGAQTAEAKVVLTPLGDQPEAKPLVIAVAAQTNACDELAAEPLDIQAVTDGVYPNDIKVKDAMTACEKAISDFPAVARFKFQYGRVLYADGHYEAAVKMMRAALDQGHVRAGQFLGRLYQIGSGVERDPAKAPALFETAADRGDPYGQYSLGKALVEGNGVKQDLKRGMDLLARAAESGHTYALNQLGSEYLYGTRVKKDVERAYVMFEKSAGRGDVWGEVNLGLMYRDGVFVKKDPARAYELFEQANGKLHPYAGTLMAMMDRDGGKADSATLLKLFRQSAGRGDGWGAYYAAEMLSGEGSNAGDRETATRLYALAAAQKAGKATATSRAKLEAMPEAQLVAEIKTLLTEMGATGVPTGDALSEADRKAASGLLGTDAPIETVDLLVALARQQWIELDAALGHAVMRHAVNLSGAWRISMTRLPTAILCLTAMAASGCTVMPPMLEPEPTLIRVIKPAPARKTTVKTTPVYRPPTRRRPSMPVVTQPPVMVPVQGGGGGGGGGGPSGGGGGPSGGGGGNEGPSGGGWG